MYADGHIYIHIIPNSRPNATYPFSSRLYSHPAISPLEIELPTWTYVCYRNAFKKRKMSMLYNMRRAHVALSTGASRGSSTAAQLRTARLSFHEIPPTRKFSHPEPRGRRISAWAESPWGPRGNSMVPAEILLPRGSRGRVWVPADGKRGCVFIGLVVR